MESPAGNMVMSPIAGAQTGKDNYAYKPVGEGNSNRRGETGGIYGGWDQTGGYKDGSGPDKDSEVVHV